MSWIVVNEEEARADWDEWARAFAFCSPFQSFSMGLHHRNLGKTVCFCVFRSAGGEVEALALCVVKRRVAGLAFVACIGGPLGAIEHWSGLPAALKQHLHAIGVYLRFRGDVADELETRLRLQKGGWQRSLPDGNVQQTACLDLGQDLASLERGFSGRWRENLRCARRAPVKLRPCVDADEEAIISAYLEMHSLKKFSSSMTKARLRKLFRDRGHSILFLCATDEAGALLAFRCVLILGDQAVDYIAATNAAGRSRRASFPLLWYEIELLKARGIRDYDLGGIDPMHNPGVTQFKLGAGAKARQQLGEYDLSTSPQLRLLVKLASLATERNAPQVSATTPAAGDNRAA